MSGRVDSAMLLAAGLGTRLRPLTLTTPKPLLPLDGCCLIDHQLRYLAAAGIRRIAINLHHLGGQIREHVGDGSRFGVSVHYAEELQLLDTGGGIKNAGPFFQGRPFVALNSDALLDADIAAVIRRHLESNAVATMLVKPLSDGDAYTPVAVNTAGMVTGFGSGHHFYTGLQVLGTEVLSALPAAGTPSSLIADGYLKLLAAGRPIAASIHHGYFNDLGTPERYEQARDDIAAGTFRLIP